jgi:hypothetical protein
VQYFDEDDNEIDAIVKGGRTHVKVTFLGEWGTPCTYGPDLVTNGDMSNGSATPWILSVGTATYVMGAGITISAGGYTYQPIAGIVAGRKYKLIYTVDNIDFSPGATVTPTLGSNTFTARTADGTYTQEILANATGTFNLQFDCTGTNLCRITNVELYACISDNGSPAGDIFADLPALGGRNTLVHATTEHTVEPNTAFRSVIADPDADQSWSSETLTINLFNFDKITLETWFDDRVLGWSNIATEILMQARLRFIQDCYLLNEDETYILDENGQRIKLETC